MLPAINRRVPETSSIRSPISSSAGLVASHRPGSFSSAQAPLSRPADSFASSSVDSNVPDWTPENPDWRLRSHSSLSGILDGSRYRELIRDQATDYRMYALDTCNADTDNTGVRRYLDCCVELGMRPRMQVPLLIAFESRPLVSIFSGMEGEEPLFFFTNLAMF